MEESESKLLGIVKVVDGGKSMVAVQMAGVEWDDMICLWERDRDRDRFWTMPWSSK